jgi:hypothetical protein
LKSPDAVDAVRRLVATTDILVENFRPAYAVSSIFDAKYPNSLRKFHVR